MILVDLGQILLDDYIVYMHLVKTDIGPMFLPSERRCLKGS